jgi:formyl-CoA transferase
MLGMALRAVAYGAAQGLGEFGDKRAVKPMMELIEDETLAELGSIVTVEHPERGSFKTVGSPLRLSDSPVDIVRSPMLGEHTDSICAELGYSPDQLEQFRSVGAI